MDFDDMLEELGELGTFQITTYILVCFPVLFSAANSLSYVFTAGVPNYRCSVPDCDDPMYPKYSEEWVPWAIPYESSSQSHEFHPSLCQRYIVNSTISNNTCFQELFTKNIEDCSEWVFDNERTIVNDWKITCLNNQWKLSLVGTCHFAGIVVGSALFGILADRYGRKIIFIFCTLLMSFSGIAQVLAPEYISFVVFIFINALGTSGVYPLAFIIGVELVGKKKREITGMVLNYFYAIGEAMVALIAWLAKDWVILQLSVSAPPLLFAIYYWIIPESVRWLLAKQKTAKAKGIVCKAAKVNKVMLSESVLESFEEESPIQIQSKNQQKKEVDILPVVKLMIKSRKLVVRFSIVFFVWAVNAFVYYGLSVNSTSMSGDKYVNFALVSLIEIPGYSLAWVCIQKIGRRPSLIASLLLCGITCTIIIFVPKHMTWAIILLFLTGKLGITASFGIIYVHTAEMLPTVIRSGGVGAASTIARLGALLAPFVPLLGVYVKPLPMILFGTVAILAGLLALKLPETRGIKLPENVQEAHQL